jgi:propionate catabolism operon transcriptional regulator
MPLPLQTRLLRVLEEREVVRVGGTRPISVDVRIVSATHCDLDTFIRTNRFRADLFYRLGVLRLTLPPLRERAEDLVPLAEWCLKNALASLGVRPHANLHAEVVACAPLLASYAWPGNVRELRNLMQRLALFLAAEPLQALTPSFVNAVAPELAGKPVLMSESTLNYPSVAMPSSASESIEEVLARYGGNREAAAKHLGISRTTLWRKLKQHT